MRKFVFSALALLSLTQVASATSIRSVLLNSREVATDPGNVGMPLKSLIVYADGEVVQMECKNKLRIACQVKRIAQLDAYQVDDLSHLVEKARGGKIVRVPSNAKCFVMPFKTRLTDADNGSVFLKSGDICTGFKVNTSSAAKKLVHYMESFGNKILNSEVE